MSLLSACADRLDPASLPGLKGVFHDPGFAVKGATRKDQAWVSETQETGIRVLGWQRPKAERTASAKRKLAIIKKAPDLPAPAIERESAPSAPAQSPPKKKRIRDRIRELLPH